MNLKNNLKNNLKIVKNSYNQPKIATISQK